MPQAPRETPVAPAQPLSPREMQVMELLVAGRDYKQAARELEISPSTIRNHAGKIYRKLGVSKLAPAIFRMQELGWLAAGDPPPKDPCKAGGEVIDYYPDLEPVTPAQRLYIQAFDRYLAAKSGTADEAKARGEMKYMLGAIYIEQQLEPSPDHGPAHIGQRKRITAAAA